MGDGVCYHHEADGATVFQALTTPDHTDVATQQ